jgi:hypothetical protein
MATVLEEYSTEEHRYVVRFLWAEGLSGEDINKLFLFKVDSVTFMCLVR